MMSLDGINGQSIQMLLRGENDLKQSNEIQAINYRHLTEIYSHYYGLSLTWRLTQGPWHVRYKGS